VNKETMMLSTGFQGKENEKLNKRKRYMLRITVIGAMNTKLLLDIIRILIAKSIKALILRPAIRSVFFAIQKTDTEETAIKARLNITWMGRSL